MKKCITYIIFFLILITVFLGIWLLVRGNTIALLDPKGMIALRERNIIIVSVLLMLIAVVPAYVLLFTFARKYRATSKKISVNETNTAIHNKYLVIFIWTLPTIVVIILSFLNWKNTHALDPYKPISSNMKPLTIQVVALQWKWLFIYPEQHIATINYVQFPTQTPVHFELTADNAPMNLFWIPQLGGQMAAMGGMITQHNLIANKTGEFIGSASEMNGRGFAGMRFIAKATSQEDFAAWIRFVQASPQSLTLNAYTTLAEPSENNPVSYYSSVDNNLYNKIVMNYMMPISPTMPDMQNMKMY